MRDRLTPPRLRSGRRPPLRQLLPDLALGMIASLGLAPFDVWGLAPVAFAILIWRACRANPQAAFWHLLAAGLGWFGLGMSWIVEPFLVEPEIYGWMAPFALILMALGGALFWAIPGWLAALAAPGWRSRSLTIAAALVLSDWLRGWLFTGLPWNLVGHTWISTPIAQIASSTGAIGLSAITMALAVLPAALWRPFERRATGFLPGIGLAILATGGLWALGLNRLARPLPPDTDFTIRIVQPDAEQKLKWDPEWSAVFFRRLLDLSAEPGPRDLVIWPETAVNFLLNDAEGVLPVLAGSAGAPLVTGIQRREGGRYFNSLVALDAQGRPEAVYDKFHLVPFGEYIPWGDALARFGISAFAAQSGRGYSSGSGPASMQAGKLPPFQPLICYEAIFPQHLRGLDNRPAWLLQATNDGWFGRFLGPYQHLAQARLRSIESGLPMMRAANTGVSAVIDARGAVRQSLGLGVAGKIDAKLPGALPPTVWIRWGSMPVVVLVALVLLMAAAAPRLFRRKGGAAPRR
ncbi:apolipoprotein N-acyltransferase [Paracoccus sp. (in: a-proteobacteria)]|uniref:apolipoprotein N-acyltransferase n=1 Tax=Paracoccus sp. TaxID=267 RepID=UPI0040599BDE